MKVKNFKNKKLLYIFFAAGVLTLILFSVFGIYSAKTFSDKSKIVIILNLNNKNYILNFFKPSAQKILNHKDEIVIKDPKLFDLKFRNRENLIMRVVGKPGEIITIRDTKVYVNDEYLEFSDPLYFCYRITFKESVDFGKILKPYDVKILEILSDAKSCNVWCNENVAEEISKIQGILNIRKVFLLANTNNRGTFPHSDFFSWNKDNFGPVLIPYKGMDVKLNYRNIALYKRIIDYYEDHELYYDYNKILIDGVQTDSYTFKKDYYFVLSDDRYSTHDSRVWGFLPEDFIIGKVLF
ncbi:MAG: S26 family signal peptidase [Bacteroidales bacterium]|jgi:signal peptidase I|nr:S26 family signal peptidase [Bacteroidales bacterium]HPD23387.1 S26 family signal peptidase [Bacteroidales bacterium]HRS99445.1 S26 family signal peptidase [Bacteroidales bacterium]HRT80324.1 S26 family signal peptidase [Bacteroidales bacterium]